LWWRPFASFSSTGFPLAFSPNSGLWLPRVALVPPRPWFVWSPKSLKGNDIVVFFPDRRNPNVGSCVPEIYAIPLRLFLVCAWPDIFFSGSRLKTFPEPPRLLKCFVSVCALQGTLMVASDKGFEHTEPSLVSPCDPSPRGNLEQVYQLSPQMKLLSKRFSLPQLAQVR